MAGLGWMRGSCEGNSVGHPNQHCLAMLNSTSFSKSVIVKIKATMS